MIQADARAAARQQRDRRAGACPVGLDGIDQRGVPRSDGTCDIGACEVNLELIFADGFGIGAVPAAGAPSP